MRFRCCSYNRRDSKVVEVEFKTHRNVCVRVGDAAVSFHVSDYFTNFCKVPAIRGKLLDACS